MRRLFFLLLTLILLSQCKKPEFQKQDILVTGTSEPVISLDGTWKFTMHPPDNFYMNEVAGSDWNDIHVPGECAMQGFAIKHNIPYIYKTSVLMPADYAGKIIKLRFEGVYSYARVWINGVFIRDHSGGFTPWECDLTKYVVPGSFALITLEFTDRDDDLSYASGYAKHQIGGILRSVSIHALPVNFPEAIRINTEFDSKYKDADLKIKVVKGQSDETWVGFRMYDRNGNQVRLNDRRYRLKNDTSVFSFKTHNPFQWDAENPNLYTLIVEVFNKSILTASYKTKFGFREIKISGNKLLVNGHQVKLRGACRQDMHPLLGRVSTPDYDKKDVLLAKEANINFIRTSHYPASESFLRFCDEYGIYVEDESAVCFVNTHRNWPYKDLKQSGPGFLSQQLSQVEEMVQNHINHPSVIIWSLGNESIYNEGFKMGYDYIKSTDPTRPVIFSYPGSVPDSVRCYDLLSMHYPSWNGILNQWGINVKNFNYEKMPVIFDEWAHVPCYDKPELLEDMNVRNFWGQSLDSMWNNLYESGGTGGAIWGMIDETFMLPDTLSGYNKWWGIQEENNGIKTFEGPTVGYGEWGIVDVWRRKKPEFWNTKKAYSPVKVLKEEIVNFRPFLPLQIPVYNRFNHTSLKDIKLVWNYRKRTASEKMRNIGPHEKGEIMLPPANWKEGETINLKFLGRDSILIDEYNIRLGKSKMTLPVLSPGEIKLQEKTPDKTDIISDIFTATLNKKTGKIENVVTGNDTVLKSGPWLNIKYADKDHWSVVKMITEENLFIPEKIHYEVKDGIVEINETGKQGILRIDFNYRISPNGVILVGYNVKGLPETKKAEEFGLRFLAGRNPQALLWLRKSYWNSYPADHIGATKGIVEFDDINHNIYREEPPGEWEFDNKSFYYNGLNDSGSLSYLAGSTRENIYTYSLTYSAQHILTVFSAGDHACRTKRDESGQVLFVNKIWDYPGLKWGNYFKNQQFPQQISDTIMLKIK